MRVEFILIEGSWFRADTILPLKFIGKRYKAGRPRVAQLEKNQIDVFGTEPITIGRDKKCDIILDSNSVSRTHCMIFFDGNKAFFKDMSTHGTKVIHEKAAEYSGGTVLQNKKLQL